MILLFPWEPPKVIKGVADVEYLKGKYPDNVWMEYEFAKALSMPQEQRSSSDSENIITQNRR